jgi:RHH-type rel operon transcriptional repressor/antitoxin RelB
MSIHTLRLPAQLESELNHLVQETGRTKSYFFVEALKIYLEDRTDYIRAAAILERVESGELKTKSLSDVMSKYDLAN